MKALKVTAFVLLVLGILFAAEMSQAIAESWLAGDESQMATLVNQHRSSHGIGTLQVNDAMRTVARRQAQRMVMAGYIYHNPDLGKEADAAVPGWRLLGENVGVGTDTDVVEQAFLDSPNHHKNIDTSQFNIVGVGAMAADDGSRYYTQNFAQWNGGAPVSASNARAKPAAPAPQVVRAPRAPAPPAQVKGEQRSAPTPVPTLAPTPEPTPVPTAEPTPVPSAEAVVQPAVNLPNGLLAMIARFFAKLAFWN